MLSPKEFQELYISMYEARDDDAREMRRLAAAERRAGNSDRMDAKTASKYAGSEAQSAARADKKSKGKHIHGMTDSYEANGDLVDEAKVDAGLSKDEKETARNKRAGITNHPLIGNKRGQNMHRTFAHIDQRGEKKERGSKSGDSWSTVYGKNKSGKLERKYQEYSGTKKPRIEEGIDEAKDNSYLETDMKKRASNNEKAIEDMKKTKAHADMVKAARKHFEGKEQLELELRAHLRERALDKSETKEKESVYKAIKPSKLAKSYPEKSPKELKSLRYAISTSQAKKNMDTSRSDKRYGVEG
jgi:folate-dependent phosphoribosylglycinamide formyltransferase PurN